MSSADRAFISTHFRLSTVSRRTLSEPFVLFLLLFAAITVLAEEPVKNMAAVEESLPRHYELQEEPKAGENYAFASIQFWLPLATEKVEGILCVVLHPHGEAAVRFDAPRPWIELAARHHCALASISFVPIHSDDDPWCRAADGSGRALLSAIDKIADASETPGLRNLPLVVTGVCEAGQFAYEFSSYAPGRCAGFLTIGGGKHDLRLVKSTAGTRGMLIAAEDRGVDAVRNVFELFEKGRSHQAPWSLQLEAIETYDKGRCSQNALRFLEVSLLRCNQSLGGASVRNDGQESECVTVPLKETLQDNAAIAANRDVVVARILNGGLDCLVPRVATMPDSQTLGTSPQTTPLSFVSVPLPALGTVTPPFVEIGSISKSVAPPAGKPAEFEISCPAGSNIDEVRVYPGQPGLIAESQPSGANRWRINCRVVPNDLPCGAVHFDVPIRFYQSGKPLLGGVTAAIVGKVSGDIRAEPPAICVYFLGKDTQGCRLNLKSMSGTDTDVLSIRSTIPEWATAEVAAKHGASVELECKFAPPPALAGQPFRGFFFVRTSHDIHKIFFYGIVPSNP